MRRSIISLLVVALFGAACAQNGAEPLATSATTTPEASPSSPSEQSPSPSPSPDEPKEPSEKRTWAEKTAARLANVDRNFYDELDVWIADNDAKPRGARFRRLEVLGLKKQKMMRRLVKFPKLYRDVLPLLPTGLRLETKRNYKAARELYRLTPPASGKIRMKTTPPHAPKKLLKLYDKAEKRFDIPWSILASINLIESRMGRIMGPSSAGALGPMQFMPATWDAYGHGSPFNPHNAIMAAARYLSASGAPGNMRGALWNYNHSDYYVDAVITYHRQMKARPISYFSYWFWQVFVRTTKGDKQLTGPGSNYPY